MNVANLVMFLESSNHITSLSMIIPTQPTSDAVGAADILLGIWRLSQILLQRETEGHVCLRQHITDLLRIASRLHAVCLVQHLMLASSMFGVQGIGETFVHVDVHSKRMIGIGPCETPVRSLQELDQVREYPNTTSYRMLS
jgi:hypothetical protein